MTQTLDERTLTDLDLERMFHDEEKCAVIVMTMPFTRQESAPCERPAARVLLTQCPTHGAKRQGICHLHLFMIQVTKRLRSLRCGIGMCELPLEWRLL